jgi:hypothetical protein
VHVLAKNRELLGQVAVAIEDVLETFSRCAARATASRIARSSFTSDSCVAWIEELSSIMLSVISGLIAPGCPTFPSNSSRSAASRARL